jgi:DnaJ-class molecular chaperone
VRRAFTAPVDDDRCRWDISLRGDKSAARCMRRHTDGSLCTQHARIAARWSCEYCGGNDELPPDHCMDCTRPGAAAGAQGP